MSYIVTGYLCNNCFTGHPLAAFLRSTPYVNYPQQLLYLSGHAGTEPSKPIGARFFDASLASYNSGAQVFGLNGRAALESGGRVTVYAEFSQPFAAMENFGIGATPTSTGKMVNLQYLPKSHYFGFSGTMDLGGPMPICSACTGKWW